MITMIMSHKISDKTIGVILAIFSSFGLVLGLLAVTGIISTKYVWGGKVTEHSQLIKYELVTLVINLFILWVIAMRVGFMKNRLNTKVLRAVLIVLMLIMLLNTIGNLFAQTMFEKMLAIPTLISAIGFYTLAARRSK